jgi:hypothetical protein
MIGSWLGMMPGFHVLTITSRSRIFPCTISMNAGAKVG